MPNRPLFIAYAVATFGLASGAALGDNLVFRPHAGVGYASNVGDGSNESLFHAGGRILAAANAKQSYGIEATYLSMPANGTRVQYLAAGIVLEQRLWDWLNMSIGTIGYFGLSTGTGNPFGIVTNLGWEPSWGRISPFVTYRSEWIFSSPVISANSASAGATVRL